MGFRINTNIAALNAQRHLSGISGKLDKSLERLASGLRINKSADDASGMATSVYLRGQIRGLYQAARNANDATSMTQTAEGALDVSTNILLRLRELAVQAATDTTNRDLLVSEANQLVAELTRVATDTEFIGNTLLNGSFTSGKIQIGANQGQTISFSIGDVRAAALGERATITATLDSGTAEGGFSVGEITINNKLVAATQETDDQISVLDLVGGTQVRNFAMSYTTAGSAANSASPYGANSLFITNGVSVTSIGALTSCGAVSIAAAISNAGLTGITATAAAGVVQLTATSGYDLGFMVSGTRTAAEAISMLGVSIIGDGSFVTKINSGGTAKISGLAINGTSIAVVSLTQGASLVSGLTISGTALAGMNSISNNDTAFLNALITAINTATADTNVTARAGSGSTLILTADDGKNITIGDIASVNLTLASFTNAIGVSTAYYASSADTTTYNGESSAIAKVAAIDTIKSSTDVDALVVATEVTGTAAVTAATIAQGDIYINGIDIGAVTLLAGDSSGSLLSAINGKSSTTGVSASLDSQNRLVLEASDGRNISVVAKSTASSAINISSNVYRGGVKLNSSSNFTIGGSTVDLGNIASQTYTTSLDAAVSLIDLSTQVGADDALATLDAAIYQVSEVRSGLGAIQARISLTIVSLSTTAENLSASDSRIRDVDFAEETAVFTKNSILTQAATAILAQANQLPQLALQLLG